MLKKIRTSLKDKSLDLADFFKKIDLSVIPRKSASAVRNTIQSIEPEAKLEIKTWLISVQDVKNNPDLSKKEKQKQISKLKPSATVLTFFESLIDVMIEKIPLKNKGLLKTGVSGIGLAASFMSFRRAGVILLVLQQALPNFIMSKQFDRISEFLVTELEA